MNTIEFSGVSKRFIIRHSQPRSFQEMMVNLFHHSDAARHEEYWALRDVSFGVKPGETLGLIGANGSGKSTALKLLAGIISPTEGSITAEGRVAALLELGTGFHPDLTGRENIFLNGSIIGLSRATIKQRLDKIIGFAELERFIDVPVRNYSSGMLMRLGFAVATHVDAEILLIDEVLAVGDLAFQTKCYDHIAKLRRAGVTILFVSHQLNTVRSLCRQATWLNAGHIAASGDVDTVINSYKTWVRQHTKGADDGEAGREQRWGSGEAEITQVTLLNDSGSPTQTFRTGEAFHVRIHYVAHEPIEYPAFGIAIFTRDGDNITAPNSAWSGYAIDIIEGEGQAQYTLDPLPLQPGTYELTCAIYDRNILRPYDHHHRTYTFQVLPSQTGRMDGLVFLPHTWEHYPKPFQRCQ
jgi:ABC-type polysaccharide/polyol phosphate transport system ATPase subunit